MPRRRSQSTVRALVLGAVAVLLGFALLIGLSVAASHGDVKLNNLGDQEFRAGRADTLAKDVRRDGPVFFQEPAGGRSGDIYVQHLGDTWYAISAGNRSCTLTWTGKAFQDPCTKATYTADGAGLTRFRTHVEGRFLYVDFRTKVP